MPWTDPVHTPLPPASPPWQDAEAVRLETLQRSWQRDRQVAKRRLRRRWMVWAVLRYGLPLALVLGTAAGVWVWALPEAHRTLNEWLHPPPPSPVIDPSPSALHRAIPDPPPVPSAAGEQAAPPGTTTMPPTPAPVQPSAEPVAPGTAAQSAADTAIPPIVNSKEP